MNAGPKYQKPVWTELPPGEWEWQGEHAYYRVHLNKVTTHYQLGRRLLPTNPIHLVGTYPTLDEAKSAAEHREAAL
jgi:hypothetical protein